MCARAVHTALVADMRAAEAAVHEASLVAAAAEELRSAAGGCRARLRERFDGSRITAVASLAPAPSADPRPHATTKHTTTTTTTTTTACGGGSGTRLGGGGGAHAAVRARCAGASGCGTQSCAGAAEHAARGRVRGGGRRRCAAAAPRHRASMPAPPAVDARGYTGWLPPCYSSRTAKVLLRRVEAARVRARGLERAAAGRDARRRS